MPTDIGRRGLTRANLGDAPDQEVALNNLAVDLSDVAMHRYGTLGARPAANAAAPALPGPTGAGRAGIFYHTTDTNQLFVIGPSGTTWHEIPLSPGVLVGVSMEYEGNTDPVDPRFLLEDNRLLGNAAYPELYALIGDKYRLGGDPVGQFRLAPKAGRVTVAADPSGVVLPNSPRTLGAVGGTERTALTRDNMPSFVIPIRSQNVAGGVPSYPTSGFPAPSAVRDNGADPAGSSIRFPGPSGAQVENQPFGNTQPYIVKNFIIRVK
jgi:microcystin-dependent protein